MGRFRVNAFRQRGSVGLVLRRVQEGAMSIGELGLPPVIARLAEQPRGLVLVTGPTGSGRTTTLAAMIDHVNANRAVHIVTIEDPIEVLHADKLGMVNQREVRVGAIADPDRTGGPHGDHGRERLLRMQTFDQHLVALYRDGVIELEDALGVATNPHDLQVAIRNQGLVA